MSENREPTVAAVLVTWNRRELLMGCIAGLRAQTRPVDAIVIVDNASTDGTWDALQEIRDPKMHCFRMAENGGGTAGFTHGIERALELGFDWIWLMDDDAEPTPSCLEKLWALDERRSGDAVLCPLIRGDEGLQLYHHKHVDRGDLSIRNVELDGRAVVPISANAFVGPLFPSTLVRTFGLPKVKYFIWWDDTEYTFRISDRGRRIVLATEAVILHHDKAVANPNALNWRTYYLYRNSLDFLSSHLEGFARVRALTLRLLHTLRMSLQHLRKGEKHWRIPLLGAFDFFRGRWGKVVTPQSVS